MGLAKDSSGQEVKHSLECLECLSSEIEIEIESESINRCQLRHTIRVCNECMCMPIKIIYWQAYGPYPSANILTHKAKSFSLHDSLIAHNFCMSAYNQFVHNFYYNSPTPTPAPVLDATEVNRGHRVS